MRIEATKHARNNILSSGPILSLPVRNSRSCNALAFSPVDPSRLAVGLDKVRGDPSLVIWDIQSALPALSLDASAPTPGVSPTTPNAPSPAQFSRGDMAVGRTETRILQQHAPTEIVSALAFLPQSAHLLLASISHRWLRLFDLRTATSSGNVPSKVHGIATDPFDSNRFACYADRSVTIWDARRLTTALLTFTEKDASADGTNPHLFGAYSTIEFSSGRRGMLATMGRDASCVRFWDLQQTQTDPVTNADRSKEPQVNKALRLSWANLPWNAQGGAQFANDDTTSTPYSLVLSDTRKSELTFSPPFLVSFIENPPCDEKKKKKTAKSFNRPQSSFALAPCARQHALTTNVMVVNKDGDLEMYVVYDTPKQVQWSARGELCIGAGLSCSTFPGYSPETVADPWNTLFEGGITGTPQDTPPARRRSVPLTSGHRAEESTMAGSVVLSSPLRDGSTGHNLSLAFAYRHGQPHDVATQPTDESYVTTDSAKDKSAIKARNVTWNHAIEHDILMVMRSRAIQGYGLSDVREVLILLKRKILFFLNFLAESPKHDHHSTRFHRATRFI
jgi:WD repeat-containing protein mio